MAMHRGGPYVLNVCMWGVWGCSWVSFGGLSKRKLCELGCFSFGSLASSAVCIGGIKACCDARSCMGGRVPMGIGQTRRIPAERQQSL